MRAVQQAIKIASVVAILVLSLPVTASVADGVQTGQAFCSSGSCEPEPGAVCTEGPIVEYHARWVG